MFSAMSGGFSSTVTSAWPLPLLLVFQTSDTGDTGDTGKPSGTAFCSVWGWSGPCSSPEPPLFHLVPIIRRVHQPCLTRSFTGVAGITIHTPRKGGKDD